VRFVKIQVFPSGPFETNVYLVSDAGEALVIDPAPRSFSKIKQAVEEQKLKVSFIFVTHSHWDHIGDLAKLKEALSVPVYVQKEDAQNIIEPGSDGIPCWIEVKSCLLDKLPSDGDELKVGALSFKVIHTPGHTPGSSCLYCEKEKVLFSGDTLFQGTCGNVSFATGSREDMITSLKKLSKLPKETRVLSGHGPATEIGKEEWLSHPEELIDAE
jgi:hydroxyacylglutathione hydrolase